MKSFLSLSSVSALVTFALSLPLFAAAIEGPPDKIDYQGRVLDAQGDPVAPGTTENIEMYFRIWSEISSAQPANLIWAEKQIVTVADGNFSVRLGEGDAITVASGDNVVDPMSDDPRPSLLDVFDGEERFLGVSVAPNSSTKPQAEIQPRLAFLTSPFSAVAQKAVYAEFGPSDPLIPFAAGKIEAETIETDGLNELSDTEGTGLISAGPLNGNHIALDADDIQSYANSSPTTLKLNDHGGDVEIGSIGNTTRVEGQFNVFAGANGGQFRVLDLPQVSGEQTIAILDAAFGVAGSQMRFEGDQPSVEIGQDSVGSFVVETGNNLPRFVVQQDGNVGIGDSTPSDRLSVSGNMRMNSGDIKMRTRGSGQFFLYYDPAIQFINQTDTVIGRIWQDGSANRIYISNSTNAFDGVYLNTNGNAWLNGSDERLKYDMEPVDNILDKIDKIRVRKYNKRVIDTDPETGKKIGLTEKPLRRNQNGEAIKHEIGTIAQDWLEHFPELVDEPKDDESYYGLAYPRIGVVAIGAVQELHQKVKENEAQLKERDEKIEDLEKRLAKLEALLSATAANN